MAVGVRRLRLPPVVAEPLANLRHIQTGEHGRPANARHLDELGKRRINAFVRSCDGHLNRGYSTITSFDFGLDTARRRVEATHCLPFHPLRCEESLTGTPFNRKWFRRSVNRH